MRASRPVTPRFSVPSNKLDQIGPKKRLRFGSIMLSANIYEENFSVNQLSVLATLSFLRPCYLKTVHAIPAFGYAVILQKDELAGRKGCWDCASM